MGAKARNREAIAPFLLKVLVSGDEPRLQAFHRLAIVQGRNVEHIGGLARLFGGQNDVGGVKMEIRHARIEPQAAGTAKNDDAFIDCSHADRLIHRASDHPLQRIVPYPPDQFIPLGHAYQAGDGPIGVVFGELREDGVQAGNPSSREIYVSGGEYQNVRSRPIEHAVIDICCAVRVPQRFARQAAVCNVGRAQKIVGEKLPVRLVRASVNVIGFRYLCSERTEVCLATLAELIHGIGDVFNSNVSGGQGRALIASGSMGVFLNPGFVGSQTATNDR